MTAHAGGVGVAGRANGVEDTERQLSSSSVSVVGVGQSFCQKQSFVTLKHGVVEAC
jgi:hypothetical protein